MRINGPWSDAMIYLDYIQEDDFNPSIAHDLKILQSHWKGKDVVLVCLKIKPTRKQEWQL